MSYGLRVWDAAGRLEVDITDRIPRFEASYLVPALNSGGSIATISHAGFSLSTHFFYANAPVYIEARPQSGKIDFYRWEGNTAGSSFYVFIYRA